MKLSDLLKEAFSKIDSKDKWVQGELATDKFGNPVDSDSPEACKFCSLGALLFTSPDMGMYIKALNYFATYVRYISTWNDTSTYEEVVTMWKKVITASEKWDHSDENN